MPTAYIKKLASQGKDSIEHLESKWDEAKSKAKSEGKSADYAYITSIFKNLVGASVGVDVPREVDDDLYRGQVPASLPPQVSIAAVQRLKSK